MAVLDFPNNPVPGQQYTAPAGQVYTFNGEAWVTGGSATGVVTWNTRTGNVVMNAQDVIDTGALNGLATDAVVASKADKTYVDSQNSAQDTAIAGKASTSSVNAANAAQDAVTATKLDKTDTGTTGAAKLPAGTTAQQPA